MRTLLLILLLTALSPGAIQAAIIDVYTGEAVVEDNAESERVRALPLALKHVLQKMSGFRNFDDYPLVEPALGNASAILLSFYYRNVEVVLPDGSSNDELRLVARFSAEKVDELARTLQLPLWPAERQSIDYWIVVDNGLDRRVMPVEFSYVWQSLSDLAEWRGLPVTWPKVDENGQYAIDTQLLWGGYTEDLPAGPHSAAMISAVRREGPEWNVRSNLTYNGESWTWKVKDIDIQSAMTESLQQAVDLIAAANTIAASDLGASVHQLTVAGIRNSGDYARCLAYLQQLGVVSEVSVVSAQPGNVTFRLELNALPRYLEEALLSGRFLGFDETLNSWSLLQ